MTGLNTNLYTIFYHLVVAYFFGATLYICDQNKTARVEVSTYGDNWHRCRLQVNGMPSSPRFLPCSLMQLYHGVNR